MILEIFNVEHGACALLTCDNGSRLMIDCGHNSTTNWRPGMYLANAGVHTLNKLIISNFDEDHVSGLPDILSSGIYIDWLQTNVTVTPATIMQLKRNHGVGVGIRALVQMMGGFGPSVNPQPLFPNVQQSFFYNTYGSSNGQFDDENNLSLVTFLSINGLGFMFPGDLELSGWRALLASNPGFRSAVANTNVLVASHHGRQSGVCEDIFDTWNCKPLVVVISDDSHQYASQKTVDYYNRKASGIPNFRQQGIRSVLSTRNDGHITFAFGPQGWTVY